MAFRNKIKQSNEIKNRIVYWGGNETTIIPTMASQGEVERAKRLNKIEEDLLGLKEKGKNLTNEDSKEKDKILKKTIALKNEKRQLQKEEAAHQAHMLKKEMELSGLKSKVLDLEESIGTVQRKGLNYVTKAGKHVKTRGQLVMKLSREYFLQGLHHQNMFNTQANMARMLETINTIKNKAVKYDTKAAEMAQLEVDEIDKLQTAKNADSTEGKARIAATLAGAAAYKGSLELVKDSYTQIGEIQSENLGATVKLAKMYGNLGKGGFQDMTKEMETQLQRAKDQAKFTLTEQLPALQKELKLMKMKMKHMDKGSDLYKKMVEDMAEMESEGELIADNAEAAVLAAEKNVKHAQLMSKIQGNVAASSQLILGPFEKMQGLLESNPLGKWVSTLTGLDTHMKTFADTVSEEMTSAFTPPTVKSGMDKNGKQFFMDLETGRRISEETYDSQKKNGQTMQESLANVQEQAMGAIDKISASFGQMNAMMGGMLGPILGIVAVLMVAKKVAEMFYGGITETRKEFGLTFAEAGKLQSMLNTTAMEFQLMGVSAEDVKAGAQGIMDNLGGIGQVTRENLQTFASLNATLGLSGESAGVLASQMMAVGAGSIEAVGAQLESVGALAQASGVAPAQVLEDVAGASEAFAGYAKEGGMNVMKAAISARQLGISMSTVAGTADALLDFESSINAQMEASMLTGRNINTDKARELALAGDLEGMQKEITKQIGSAADYEKLNVVQRKAMAAAFGVSVSELGKMVTNQDKLNNMTEEQVKRTDLIASLVQGLNTAWVSVMETLKSVIPLAIGILSPVLLIAGAFAGVIIVVGKVLAMFNKLSIGGVGLGDVVMFITGAFIGYKLAMMAVNTAKGKSILLTTKEIALKVWEKAVTIGSTVARWANTAATWAANIAVSSGIAAMFGYTAASAGATAGTWSLNAALSANPIGAIILGVIALVAVIALLVKKFGLMKVVKTMLMAAFFPLIMIIGVFKLIYKGVASLVERLGGIGQVMKYVGAAFLVVMGPIGWLIGAGILIYKNFDKIKEVVSAVGKSIFDFMMKPINFVLDGIKSMVTALGGFKNMAMTALKIAFAPLFLAYKIFQKAKGFIGSFFGGGDKSTEAVSSATSGGAPEMHSGGVVKETGNAVVEKGEVVSTPQQQQQQQQQQSSTISTQAMESKLDELIQLLGQSGPISIGVGGVKSNTKAISEQIV